MNKPIKAIAVLTSGGDSPGMNAAIRAVVRAAVFNNIKCFGIYRGYQGLIEDEFEELGPRSVRNLINRGGTFLKSARSKQFREYEYRKKSYDNLKNRDIDALVVIGGDGSFTGAEIFSDEFDIPVIGIPGTIDNDINGTDYTLGYDTALNTVVEAIDKIRDTASSHDRLFLVEVMGRDAGDIALNSGIGAGAEEILIPEEEQGVEKLIESLHRSRKTGKTSSIVVVAEGDQIGRNIAKLALRLEKELPEYETKVTVLGHIQRGGSPSCFDRVLASRLGVGAVDALIEGRSNIMVGIEHGKVVHVPFETAITKKKTLDFDLMRVADIVSI
jgi:6-phosphofructokinase 1